MIDDLRKIVSDLLPNSPISFFQTLPQTDNGILLCGVNIPVLNDFLVREELIEQAIGSYTAIHYVDYKIELLSMCLLVKEKFDLSDNDTLERVNSIMSFELSGEGDLEFITTYNEDIRNLTLLKIKKQNYDYLFPFYFVYNRTGIELDLSLVENSEYEKLLNFIELEKSADKLEQLDDAIDIKKP